MKSINLFIALLLLTVSCSEKKSQSQAVRFDDFFTTIYMPDQGGITGADGTISILLEDGSSMFMTGDCFAGKVVGGQRDPKSKLINNSLIHISKDYKYLGSHFKGTSENPQTLFVPLEAASSTVAYWYWPGHGFQQGNTLHLFMTKFYQGGEGQWGFRYDGVDYLRVNMDDYSVISCDEIYDQSTPVHWGHCLMKDGDYYYVYGTRSGLDYEPAELCVSRAKFDNSTDKLGAYEYFDGTQWVATPTSAAACQGLDVSVSEQFSVFKHNDKYVLLTQRRAQQTGDIYTYIADSQTGPWRNKKQHYVTTEQNDNKDLFTYNAMAHPQYINEKNELLICYNINSYKVETIFSDVKTYRPVFMRVPMSMILE